MMDLKDFEKALFAPPKMSETKKRLAIEELITRNGFQKQGIIIMEELAELIQQVSKTLRGCGNKIALLEEMADVSICLKMLLNMNLITESSLDEAVAIKLQRALETTEVKK